MITIAPAKSLQERFLNDFVDKVLPEDGSETQRLCCGLRFHPLNKKKRSSNLTETIQKELKIEFPSTNMPATLGEVIKKIKERFGDAMQADGVPVDLLTGTRGRQRQYPDAKSPWQIIYEWLWEIEFPRQGWKLGQEMATYAIEELQMIELQNGDRDICLNNVAKTPATIHKEKKYALQVDFPHSGHLLLINQGVSGKRYCLCPSLAFSLETQVVPEKKLHIPGIKALASALQYMDMGSEYFLAILTENPVNLSWVHPESNPNDILVTDERLQEIFKQVGRQWNAQVFYKKFEVVE
ncbi:hypothetical protein [Oscillatoria acuminata]|uniref:DUF4384 domain-containing protein n=1 Tax=Oscillatoria acuminata PCC 6304 TaxID=56110 RepID=K9TDX2_9CYAN|nr:hypothetical protein [Oscillatoria acuminata]AFY80311.1 hypothetical protein Oscil6304_0570 [Oscillatoria acuminata PCC 6304]